MRTQKEIETTKSLYDTSRILLNLFSKYDNYDSTLKGNHNSNILTRNENGISESADSEKTSVIVSEHKKSIFKKIIDKIKSFFIT